MTQNYSGLHKSGKLGKIVFRDRCSGIVIPFLFVYYLFSVELVPRTYKKQYTQIKLISSLRTKLTVDRCRRLFSNNKKPKPFESLSLRGQWRNVRLGGPRAYIKTPNVRTSVNVFQRFPLDKRIIIIIRRKRQNRFYRRYNNIVCALHFRLLRASSGSNLSTTQSNRAETRPCERTSYSWGSRFTTTALYILRHAMATTRVRGGAQRVILLPRRADRDVVMRVLRPVRRRRRRRTTKPGSFFPPQPRR